MTEGETASQGSSVASSPLQHKGSKLKAKQAATSRPLKGKPRESSPECIGLRDKDMAIDNVDADETMTIGEEEEDEDEDEVASSIVDDESSDDEGSWEPSERSSPAPGTADDDDELLLISPPAEKPVRNKSSAKSSAIGSTSRVTQSVDGLQNRMKQMSLFADEDDEEMDSEEEEPVVAAKKGRGSKATVSSAGSTSVRRSTRGKK